MENKNFLLISITKLQISSYTQSAQTRVNIATSKFTSSFKSSKEIRKIIHLTFTIYRYIGGSLNRISSPYYYCAQKFISNAISLHID